ncbi:MAG: hypothetical protein P0Y53_19225 [Candidatus Pseudobacter hemicellulosilyticus]|uniref:Uncharacterized protein n=1 Tax=Candidatus Pseudobacter hemicellulosilyticus TaxID=3121375 RepID=A0AAJ6BGC2_9BACT|nr:MAG: hypothetical protein P0Y53_19225 [Pseudobacter sp.]
MKPFLKSGATILLTPSGPWQWVGWDGRLTISSAMHALHLSDAAIITEADVPAFTLLAPRQYTATAFADTPGTVSNAIFMDDKPTLSDKIKVNGAYPLLLTTTGTFTCLCAFPSTRLIPGGAIPDPLLAKSGTWKVIDPHQQVLFRKSAVPGRQEPCVEAQVAQMSHKEKIMAAINKSEISDALLAEIDVEALATSIVVVGVVLVTLAATGFGALVELVAAALLLTGAALSGYEIGSGLAHLADFYGQTKNATTCAAIEEAAGSFSTAVAKIGIGGVGAALSIAGAKQLPVKNILAREAKSPVKGRKAIKGWLKNVGNLEREQLIKDLKSADFKVIHEKGGRTVLQREGKKLKIRLDPPDNATPNNHMHITRGGDRETYNIDLKKVNYKTKEAHITIK